MDFVPAKTRYWVKLSLALASLLCVAFSSAPPKAVNIGISSSESLQSGQQLLSTVIRERTIGVSLDDAASREKVLAQSEEFFTWLKLKRNSPQRKAFQDRCEKLTQGAVKPESEESDVDEEGAPTAPAEKEKVATAATPSPSPSLLPPSAPVATTDENPFCVLATDAASRHEPRPRRVRLNRANVRLATRTFLKGSIDGLDKFPEAELLAGIKKIPQSRSLDKAMHAALDMGPCPSTAILSALGLRAEMGFPDPNQKGLATDLYTRAISCGEDLSSVRAAYRLGLLKIWDSKFEEADRVFSKILENPLGVDFRLRALYWRYFSAVQNKNDDLRDEMQSKLLREYPLSLHALFVGGGPGQVEQKILSSQDPALSLRSNIKKSLNPYLAAAEILQAKGEAQAAADLLEYVMDSTNTQNLMKDAEPSVRLYTSVLLMRSGESLHKFKFMASIFHDYPTLISQETLGMLYPLQRFEIIRNYESTIDPYLVISLIRQESAFNEHARSGAGALGLMQLMPRTARRLEHRVSRRQLLDPAVNVRIGVRFFARLVSLYGGDAELALAAYNAGSDRIEEWKARYPVQNRLLFIDMMPFRETREYVASIARNYYWYLRLYNPEGFRARIPASGASLERSPTSPAAITPTTPGFPVFSFYHLPPTT